MDYLTEQVTPNLLLYSRELADLYALKTLNDYLEESKADGKINANIIFAGYVNSNRSKQIVQNKTILDDSVKNIDCIVGCCSDIGISGDISIDISILKNCVNPLSNESKQKLKEKYGVTSSKPIVVIGYAVSGSEINRLIEEFSKYSEIYIVQSTNIEEYTFNPNVRKRVHFVDEFGVLKDYFAMADLAIYGDTLSVKNDMTLHNFVEATENGPLFLVPTINTRQYGYNQLVNLGVIVEAASYDELVNKATAYLELLSDEKTFQFARESHHANRAAHLKISRETYLPVLFENIKFALGQSIKPIFNKDIIFQTKRKQVIIYHKQSDWGKDGSSFLPLHIEKMRAETPSLEKTELVKLFEKHTQPLTYNSTLAQLIFDDKLVERENPVCLLSDTLGIILSAKNLFNTECAVKPPLSLFLDKKTDEFAKTNNTHQPVFNPYCDFSNTFI